MNTQSRTKCKFFKIGQTPFPFLVLFVLFTDQAFGQTFEQYANRKVINEKGYKEIVYITDKTPQAKGKRSYHWYKSRKVHASQNNYAGKLLDGDYVRYYPSNQLAEKGYFENGLKVALWTTWHSNGKVASAMRWKNGRRNGKYIQRDSLGTIVELGTYKKGLKTGKWMYPVTGDTLYFKKGALVPLDSIINDSLQKKTSFLKRLFKKKDTIATKGVSEETLKKNNFFKRLFAKKERDAKIKPKRNGKRKNNGKDKKALDTTTDKEGFLKRLFKKKNKPQKKTNA
ncbi:toxin-antitoxin system YwqK family antitoxin [Flagellimonas sp. CMM7]|uniref:toxin-antitoxin system YwqK family antitoxin n=1 Tax=Flagellimonas sp. CMM7 TaxID=2654676 RepID=UPI0013D1EF6B|nr:hypothetical protein [Flagellimonas sp. CMM7]UII80119.1 hypothetical protein LV704_01030 [Flagellimonas sp. CMM7]